MPWTLSTCRANLDKVNDVGSEVVGLGGCDDAAGGSHCTRITFWDTGPEVLEHRLASTTSLLFGPPVHRGRILFRAAKAAEGISLMPPTIPHLVAKVWTLDGYGGYV